MITGAFPNLMVGLAGFFKSAAQMEMERQAFLQARNNAETAFESARRAIYAAVSRDRKNSKGMIIDGECEDVTDQALLVAKPRRIGG